MYNILARSKIIHGSHSCIFQYDQNRLKSNRSENFRAVLWQIAFEHVNFDYHAHNLWQKEFKKARNKRHEFVAIMKARRSKRRLTAFALLSACCPAELEKIQQWFIGIVLIPYYKSRSVDSDGEIVTTCQTFHKKSESTSAISNWNERHFRYCTRQEVKNINCFATCKTCCNSITIRSWMGNEVRC